METGPTRNRQRPEAVMESSMSPGNHRTVDASAQRPLAFFALIPAVLVTVWVVSKAQWFWTHRPDLQFGWIVVLLCGYLGWEAWEKKPAEKFRWVGVTTLLFATGCALLFLVQVYQAAFGMNAATLLGLTLGGGTLIMANLHYVFGWTGVRHFAFPCAFFLIALPMPSAVQNLIVGGLQSQIASLNVEVLNLIGIPARQTGSLIQLPNCMVGVDEACSGIRSLQSTMMATLFIGYLTLQRLSLRMVLLGCGIGLAMVGNLARSLFLSYTANARGLEALEAYHDTAGWSILAFTAGGVALLAWGLGKVEQRAARMTSGAGEMPQARDGAAESGT